MFNGKTNGSLSKRVLANGRTAWQIAIACGYKEVEKRGKKQRKRDFIYRTVHVPKNEAKRIMREMQNEIESNNGCSIHSPCKITLREWNERWLRDFTQHIEASTRSGYRTNLEYVGRSALAKTPLSQLSTFSFQEFFNSLLTSSTKGTNMPLSPKTIRHIYTVQREALEQAVVLRQIPFNPVDGISLPKRKTQQRSFYSEEELQELLRIATENPKTELFISLFILTGMRRGEITALRFSDVDFEKGCISVKSNRVRGEYGEVVEKGPKSINGFRTIPIPDKLVSLLHNELQRRKKEGLSDEFVLENGKGEPMKPDSVTRFWRRFLEKHPDVRPLRLHDIRHSHVTMLVNNAVPPAVTAARIGDTVATAMTVYSHSDAAQEQKAGELVNRLLCG